MIDIDEEAYNEIMDDAKNTPRNLSHYERIIAKGNPIAFGDEIHNEWEKAYIIGHKHGYIQGWHDAIITALKETHSVYTEEGHFRVVQEETLIGVGMAYEPQESEEETWQI